MTNYLVTKPKNRVVFLDRDGVINRVILRDGRPYSPRTIEEFVFNDGIQEAVRRLKEAGFKTIVVSNQPDLARGEIAQDVLDTMTRKVRSEIPVDDIYICPHDDVHQCSCRKPKPGMLIEAAMKWNIDLSASFFIGDTWKDRDAGRAAGCKTILLDAPYNQDVDPDFRIRAISECIDIICKRDRNNPSLE